MSLIESENQAGALVGHSKGRCYGEGFPSGGQVARFTASHLVNESSTEAVLVGLSPSQGVTISNKCLRVCIHFMVSRGQHRISTIGQK